MPKNILEITVLFLLMGIIVYLYNVGLSFDEMINTLAVYVLATYKIIPSFYKIMNNIQCINFALPTIDALHDTLNRNYNHNFEKKLLNYEASFNKNIILKNISFSYPNSKKKILDNLNLLAIARTPLNVPSPPR